MTRWRCYAASPEKDPTEAQRRSYSLQAIAPFDGYAARFAAGSDRQRYQHLHEPAEVTAVPEFGPDEAVYYAADAVWVCCYGPLLW